MPPLTQVWNGITPWRKKPIWDAPPQGRDIDEITLELQKTQEAILTGSSFGTVATVGNGVTDDAGIINARIDAASAFGGGIVVLPAGKTSAIGSSITLKNNVLLWGLPGSKLKMLGSIGQFNPGIDIIGAANSGVVGLEIDGNKPAWTGATTEHRHCIRVVNSSRTLLRDLYLHDAKGDGLYIGATDDTQHSDNVHSANIWCDANHRNGCSIGDLAHGVFEDLKLTNTGGTSPQCGIDIEPNSTNAICHDLTFKGLKSSGNVGPGVQVLLGTSTVGRQENFKFVGADIFSNTNVGMNLLQAKGVYVGGHSQIRSNGTNGVLVVDTTRDIEFDGGRITGNTGHGIFILGQSSGKTLTGFRASKVQIDTNTLDGIHADWTSGAVSGCIGLNVSLCHIFSNRYPLWTSANCIDFMALGNYLKGNTNSPLLNDDVATRKLGHNAGLADT